MSIDVFDFFSGCGGTSKGFEIAGLNPVFALDFDENAARTFKANFPKVHFSLSDITQFEFESLVNLIQKDRPILFSGCAPCQPFTKQNTKKPDETLDIRRSLLSYFGSIVERYVPDYIFIENVPGIQHITENNTLTKFVKRLDALGYSYEFRVIASQSYGVPQRRKRLVCLASKHGKIVFPEASHGPKRHSPYSTVRDWIGHLPAISAGEEHSSVPNHQSAKLSDLNLKRIMATPAEGSRADWPKELQLDCHTKSGYTGHTDVYGRMKWDSPSTGLTTRCISLSNGRFGHPEQHRAISIREAASLQTFPENFKFLGTLNSQAKQIGNAVPVLLAKAFGEHVLAHARLKYGKV